MAASRMRRDSVGRRNFGHIRCNIALDKALFFPSLRFKQQACPGDLQWLNLIFSGSTKEQRTSAAGVLGVSVGPLRVRQAPEWSSHVALLNGD